MGARSVCREILKLHIDSSFELPAVPDCNRIELGGRPRARARQSMNQMRLQAGRADAARCVEEFECRTMAGRPKAAFALQV
jgi:hypothetical protein